MTSVYVSYSINRIVILSFGTRLVYVLSTEVDETIHFFRLGQIRYEKSKYLSFFNKKKSRLSANVSKRYEPAILNFKMYIFTVSVCFFLR